MSVPVIGYYAHHVGRGHVQRARAVADRLSGVTVLSSLSRPASWPHWWVDLAADTGGATVDVTAGGRLHWVPVQHAGLRERMATIAAWIAEHRPSVMVVDVSVEIITLARSMGVPVVTVVQPGRRDDAAHQLGYDLASAIVAPWPDLPGLCTGLEKHSGKVHHVGAISRFDGRERLPHRTGHVLALGGLGSTESPVADRPATDGWTWTARDATTWVDDPWADICSAEVVVTHGGLGAIADVAAARRPAVVVPGRRPHDEQRRTATALADAGLAVVLDAPPSRWDAVLDAARGHDPERWRLWSRGDGADRMAEIVADVAR